MRNKTDFMSRNSQQIFSETTQRRYECKCHTWESRVQPFDTLHYYILHACVVHDVRRSMFVCCASNNSSAVGTRYNSWHVSDCEWQRRSETANDGQSQCQYWGIYTGYWLMLADSFVAMQAMWSWNTNKTVNKFVFIVRFVCRINEFNPRNWWANRDDAKLRTRR